MRRLPGSHEPNNKNRSSKQYTWLTKIRPIYRCLNGELLSKLANESNNHFAKKEIERRKNLKKNNVSAD